MVLDRGVGQGDEQHQTEVSRRDRWHWTSVAEMRKSEESEEMQQRLIFQIGYKRLHEEKKKTIHSRKFSLYTLSLQLTCVLIRTYSYSYTCTCTHISHAIEPRTSIPSRHTSKPNPSKYASNSILSNTQVKFKPNPSKRESRTCKQTQSFQTHKKKLKPSVARNLHHDSGERVAVKELRFKVVSWSTARVRTSCDVLPLEWHRLMVEGCPPFRG